MHLALALWAVLRCNRLTPEEIGTGHIISIRAIPGALANGELDCFAGLTVESTRQVTDKWCAPL